MFIFLQRFQVVWSGPEPHSVGKVEKVSRREEEAVRLKLVDLESQEGEKMKVHERVLGFDKGLQGENSYWLCLRRADSIVILVCN